MARRRFFPALYELLSSMRFAVSLLTLLAIASIIGTVLKQNEPYSSYQIEFGLFWFPVFERLGLYDVYHASWFLGIFTFLIFSTSLCLYRNCPGMLRQMRSFRSQAKVASLQLMPQHAFFAVDTQFSQKVEPYLIKMGYRFRRTARNDVILWAAKKGSMQKLGYFLAHIGIVVICIGGLIDGNVWLKMQELLGRKAAEPRHLSAKEMPPHSRLPPQNLSFRATVSIPEGRAVDFAWLNAGHGTFLQALPFILELKAFRVAYYSTGQPKLFASEVAVYKPNGEKIEGTVQVNHPLIVDGIAIYQASFGDGGSSLALERWDLQTDQPPHHLNATSLSSTPLTVNNQAYQIEWGELRVFNIENMGNSSTMAVMGSSVLEAKLNAAREVKKVRNLRNIGPSIQFKLRDAQGQAQEYLNYMQPFAEDGRYYFISGIRKTQGEELRFIRLPLDQKMRLNTFMQLRANLLNKKMVSILAKRTADKALAGEGVSLGNYVQFKTITETILTRFQQGGFLKLEKSMDESAIPEAMRSTVAQTYIKILQGVAIEAMQLAQEQSKLMLTAEDYRFALDSLLATSNLFAYGAPVYLQLTNVKHVQASGFQIARAPGKGVVYLGCLLLIVGVICMFYIREIRCWIRVERGQALVAMSSNRKNQELETMFAEQVTRLRALGQGGQNE
jgi:cytochrome c biogenesis protein